MQSERQRKKIHIEGIVQGVGFRPFVYQLAQRLGIAGWVFNDSEGVKIEAEGEPALLQVFLGALQRETPPLAAISRFALEERPVRGDTQFTIRVSENETARKAQIAPDTYVCEDCRRELFAPTDRRYRYPFINCTNCGPRFTIVTGVPYDRPKTTMADFPMCAQCRREYDDPRDRRFHAQPNACPYCGPQVRLHDACGDLLPVEDPVREAVRRLQEGQIVAIKGLGGYHLAVDAGNDAAVAELRRRKVRDEKPFALMSAGLAQVRTYAELDTAEQSLLESVERPIVLLRQCSKHPLSALVAPRNRYFGVMLPCTPLHELLLENGFTALVMTSANICDEPIVFQDEEAIERLNGVADSYLIHNRRIYMRTDDSITRVMAGRPVVMRRSRGYVPRGIFLPAGQPSVLALGAELKSAVCLTQDERAFLSQHIGDLKNMEVYRSLIATVDHLQEILELQPQILAHDLHPDYLSTRYAEERSGIPRVAVQHHHAHLASCLAENGVEDEAIGIIFDGIGFGEDGRIWGGEFLVGGFDGYRRAGHFAYVPMPGSDAATKEPYRMALSYLRHAFDAQLPELPFLKRIAEGERRLLLQMMAQGINSPLTSSCGRLFDGVAALVGLRDRVSFEGQAALELEMAIDGPAQRRTYPFALVQEGEMLIFDHAPLIRALALDVLDGIPAGVISACFHNTLAQMVRRVCDQLRQTTGLQRVALSGGVFQNRFLTERCLELLESGGFQVFTHSLVPPNDGGLALGQAVIAGRRPAG